MKIKQKKYTPLYQTLPENLEITKELVEGYGYAALEEHGYNNIPIVWKDDMKRSWGLAVFNVNRKKRLQNGRVTHKVISAEPVEIRLSNYVWDRVEDKRYMIDVVLHEVAHILAGFKAGHNNTWKMWCLKIGADPTRLVDKDKTFEVTDYKWYKTCNTCGWKYGYHKKPKATTTRTIGYLNEHKIKRTFPLICVDCKKPIDVIKAK